MVSLDQTKICKYIPYMKHDKMLEKTFSFASNNDVEEPMFS